MFNGEKKTVTVKSGARVKNIPADSTKDHALYVLFQKCKFLYSLKDFCLCVRV